eukprot:SAG11_NODE_11399_length_763_cov_1.126506_1_plen_99_part_00
MFELIKFDAIKIEASEFGRSSVSKPTVLDLVGKVPVSGPDAPVARVSAEDVEARRLRDWALTDCRFCSDAVELGVAGEEVRFMLLGGSTRLQCEPKRT